MDPKIKCILLDKISSKWKDFALNAAFDKAVTDYIDQEEKCDQLKMDELLKKLVLRNPSDFMSVVKKCLTLMGKADVLKEMEMLHASDQLKAYYLNTYGTTHRQEQSERNNLNLLLSKLKLASVEKEDLKMLNDDFNEWKYFLHKKDSYKPITYDEVFDESSRLVLISGPKGIGKTNFLQSCLYHWANGFHWKHLNFVFYFDFNKISKHQKVSNMNQLIKRFYKNILNGYEISSFTMLIMDGLDEFAYFEQLINHKSSNNIPLITALENIFRSESCKCVLSGNIATVLRYWGKIRDHKETINLQILGLNVSGTKCFMEDLSLSETLINDLETLSTSSRNGAATLSVPLYLNAACSTLFTLSLLSVKTMTELLALIFLHLVQQNCNSIEPLQQLMQTSHKHILNVCHVAFIMFGRGRVSVSQKELGLYLNEKCSDPLGFMKYSVKSQQYEFVHFVLMKFCASIHLLFNVTANEVNKNERLRSCLPFISGFVHGYDHSFLNLVCQLKESLHKQTFWLRFIYEHNDRELFSKCFFEAQVSIAEDLKLAIESRPRWIINLDEQTVLLKVSKRRYLIEKLVEAGVMKYCVQSRNEHEFKNTEKISTNVVSKQQEALINKHPDKLNAEHMKALGFYHDKQFDRAEIIFRRVEKIQNEALGEKDNDTLNTKFWIAMCLYKEQQYYFAEKMFRGVVVMRKEVLGVKHADTLNTKYWVARCLYEKQQFNSAERMFRKVENDRNEVLGEKHADTQTTKYWRARCLYANQQLDKAEKVFREVQKMRKEVFGEKHADTLSAKYWVASCLYEKQQFDSAEKMFREVEQVEKEILGEKHVDTLNTTCWVAMCQFKKQQFFCAEKLFRDVAVMQKEVLGEKHADTLKTKYWNARCLYNNKQFENAEKMFRVVGTLGKVVLGEKHAVTLISKYWNARCLYDKQKFNYAEKMFREVEKLENQVFGKKYANTLNTKCWVASCFMKNINSTTLKKYLEMLNKCEKKF